MMSKVVALVLFAGAAQAQSSSVTAQTATEFCDAYNATCADEPNPFANDTAACETWYNAAPAGTLANPIGDTEAGGTRACYQYHLSVAPGAEAIHCPHARGTTLCVAPVAQTRIEFCTAYDATCAGEPNPFADTAACETWYAAAAAGTLADPISGTAAGGTRACYQYHLSVAPGAPATHCPHARGTTLCVNSTESAASTASASAVATTLAAVVGTLFL